MALGRRAVADFVAAYRSGRRTPRDVAERALAFAAALDRRDPPMCLFTTLDPAGVRAQADASALRWRNGQPRSLLDGVPVAIKDSYDVAGEPTCAGTSFLGKTPAVRDATVVRRLREAGATLLGKTNMYELGLYPSGLNLRFGAVRNPWDPTRDTGGSSSGSAATVAVGLAPIALGTDLGGSVRIPAALCGIPSLKPSFGRLPLDGVSQLAWSLEHLGPMCATVDDVRLAFATMAGESAGALPVGPFRLGVCEAWWSAASPEVADGCRAAIARLVAAGCTEVAIELPHLALANAAGSITTLVEAAAANARPLAADAPFSPAVRAGLEFGRGMPGALYLKAQRVRTLLAADFERALAQVDLVVSPTTAIAAPRYCADAFASGELDPGRTEELVHYTFAYNLTGLPAAQVPCGHTGGGLPIGLQIAAPPGGELRALGLAALLERTTGARVPPLYVDLLE